MSVDVWIAKSATDEILREANAAVPCETGGILMGYWSESALAVAIIRVIGAGPGATHQRGAFVPDHAFQEAEIARTYRKSDRIVTYLGDWHSHPRGTDALSTTDRRTLTTILQWREARLDRPLMAIVAGGPVWNLALWMAVRTGRIRRRIEVRRLLFAEGI